MDQNQSGGEWELIDMRGGWTAKIPKYIGSRYAMWFVEIYNDNCERYVSSVSDGNVYSRTASYIDDATGRVASVNIEQLPLELREAIRGAQALVALMMD